MQYQIYVDTLFVTNFAINLFLLFLISKIIKCTATHLSIFIGAIIGSVTFCFLIVLSGISGFVKIFLSYGVIGPGMLWYSLRLKDKNSFCLAMFCFYGITFLFGGFLQFVFTRISFLKKIGVSSVSVIFIMVFAFFLLFVLIGKWKKEKENIFYDVYLKNKKMEIRAKGILDSGNLLYEPISKKPVMIIEEVLLKPYKESGLLKGFCVIPYHSIGKANGILEGYEIEEVRIEGRGVRIKKEKVLVALSKENIAANRGYQVILHSKLMEN